MVQKIRVELRGGEGPLRSACAESLSEIAEIQSSLSHGVSADLVLLVLEAPLLPGIECLARYLRDRPGLPVILLSAELTPDQATELVQVGAADYLSLPLDGVALRRKVERVLCGWVQPAFDDPLFAPLRERVVPSVGRGEVGGRERRLCYRARVPDWLPAYATIPMPGEEVRVAIHELSVDTGDGRGGMRLRLQGPQLIRVPLSSWAVGLELPARFQLPEEMEPIIGRVQVVRFDALVGLSGSQVFLAVQYWPVEARYMEKFRRFWADCQRLRPRF